MPTSERIITRKRFSNCKRHVRSSTCFSSLSFASLSAPVSLAACRKKEMDVFTKSQNEIHKYDASTYW